MQYLAAVAIETPRVETDLELARASAAGDTAAFEQLYRQHHRRVVSLCLRMLGNSTEAEDLTQDVFVQLFRKIGSFRGESAFTTWLHRMTVNQVLMHFRKRNVRPEMTTDDGELPIAIEVGTERPSRMPIVDHIVLNGDGKISSLRAFFDPKQGHSL